MKYYKTADIAEILPLSTRAIRKKISAGEFGETLNVGNMHLVSEQGLKQYIQLHTGPAHQQRETVVQIRHRHHVDCMAKI